MQRRQFMKGGLAALALAGVGSTGLFLLNRKNFISTAYAGDFFDSFADSPAVGKPG